MENRLFVRRKGAGIRVRKSNEVFSCPCPCPVFELFKSREGARSRARKTTLILIIINSRSSNVYRPVAIRIHQYGFNNRSNSNWHNRNIPATHHYPASGNGFINHRPISRNTGSAAASCHKYRGSQQNNPFHHEPLFLFVTQSVDYLTMRCQSELVNINKYVSVG